MGTISDKLEYLNDTKGLLKQKINNLGGDITDQTTFRQYADKLQTIYDNAPKTSYAEGSNITLSNTLKGKLDFENDIVGYGDTKQAILPSEYQQVEYIENTGVEYITTNYYQTSDNMQLKTKVYIPEMLTTEQDILGNQDNTNGRFVLGMYQKKIFGYSRTASIQDTNVFSSEYSGSQLLDIVLTFNSSTNTKTLNVNGVSTLANYTGIANSNKSVQIFVNGNSANGFTGRVYYVQIYENDILKLYLLPCYRISDNVIGMYDVVSNTFYTNAGTGTFAKGANTPTPNVPMNIEVVRGTQTVYIKDENNNIIDTKTINLGEYEFARIGNYVDTIEYDVENDKVYLNKAIGKTTLDNTKTYSYSNYFGTIIWTDNSIKNVASNTDIGAISNKALGISPLDLLSNNGIAQNNSNNRILVKFEGVSSYNTDTLAKQYFNSNPYIVYYILATPTRTEITGTLKDQIKAWYNSQSFTGTTIIEIDGQLPLIIKVRALKGE